MPAFQVRDMPQDLYDQLKYSAKCNHRSMAQQTVHILEQNLTDVRPTNECVRVFRTEEEERRERAERAKKIFASLDEINKNVKPISDDEIRRIWRESREEWERRTDPYTEEMIWSD